MKLKLIDRITLPAIFPQNSSFEKLIIIADIQKKIVLTQEELKEFDILEDTTKGTITWNEEGSKKEFDIDFTESEINLIAELLKKISSDEKLTQHTLPLYKLFVK
jgi:hypothetical protein